MQAKERNGPTSCTRKNKSNCRNEACLTKQTCLKDLKKRNHYLWLKRKAIEATKRRKVFTVYGQGSSAVRRALIGRGWIEKIPLNRKCYCKRRLRKNIDQSLLSSFLVEHSPNFIWGKNRSKKNRPDKHVETIIGKMKVNKKIPKKHENPMRNRLKEVNHWSTKHGISSSLKNSLWYYIENVAEVIAPRTFSNTNDQEKREFINDYHLTACTSVLKWIIAKQNKTIFHENGTISTNIIIFAINRCEEFLYMKEHRDIDCDICEMITDEQWSYFLKEYRTLIAGNKVFQIDVDRNIVELTARANDLQQKILKYRQELNCEGYFNIWIIKPSGCSRGKGIQMSSKLNRIMELINRTRKRYVVQKYIEKPLLIYNTKFDIRQYYLITSTYPLVIWMYRDCYLKFSSIQYSLKNFHKVIHLTNYAVQKLYKNGSQQHPGLPKNNMWDLKRYKKYLKEIGKPDVWDSVVYPAMKKVIVGVMLSCQNSLAASKNRFGLFGCDFILDNHFTPWLIEINNRPDLGATTKITANICPEVVADIIKVVIDRAKNPKAFTGNFECIYHQPMTRTNPYRAKALEVTGFAVQPNYFFREEKEPELTSCISSTADEHLLLKMLKRLEFIFKIDRNDNCLGKGDNEGKEISKYKIKRDPDVMTELSYVNGLDVKDSISNICINQKEADLLTEPDCGDCLESNSDVETSSYLPQIELDALSKSSCGDNLDDSDIETKNYVTQVESETFTELDSERDFGSLTNDSDEALMTISCMAQIVLDAIAKPVNGSCLNINSDMETYNSMAKISGNFLHDNSDMGTTSNTSQMQLDHITKPDYSDCLHVNLDVNTRNIGLIELDAITKPNYDDCLIANPGVSTRSYMDKMQLDSMTKLNYVDCLHANSHLNTRSCMGQMQLDAMTKTNDCLNANSDMSAMSSGQIELYAITKPNYGDCFNDISGMSSSTCMGQMQVDATTTSNNVDCLNSYSVVNTRRDRIKLDTMTKLDYCVSLDANSAINTSNRGPMLLHSMIKPDYADCWDGISEVEKKCLIARTELDTLTEPISGPDGGCFGTNPDEEAKT